jgi:hypothetical protein
VIMSSGNRHKTLLGLAAALAGFGAAAIATPVVLGQDPDGGHAADSGGPATARTVVAAGSTEQFGRWEIVVSDLKPRTEHPASACI